MNEVLLDNSKCELCCECINICSQEVLGMIASTIKVIKPEQCTYCEECVDICPNEAIEVKYDISM